MSITLQYPMLGLLAFVCFLVIYLTTRRFYRPRPILHSDTSLLARPSLVGKLLEYLSVLLVFTTALMFSISFARPTGERMQENAYTEAHAGCAVLDISSSMEQVGNSGAKRVKVASDALVAFIQERTGDNFCFVSFGEAFRYEVLPVFHKDHQPIIERLRQLAKRAPGAATPMGDGLFAALLVFLADSLPDNDKGNVDKVPVGALMELMQSSSGIPQTLEDLKKAGFTEVCPMSYEHTGYVVVSTDAQSNSGLLDPLNVLPLFEMCDIRVFIIGLDFDITSFPELVARVNATGKGDNQVFFADDLEEDLPKLYEMIDEIQKRKALSDPVYIPIDYSRLFALLGVLPLLGAFFCLFLLRFNLFWLLLAYVEHFVRLERKGAKQ
jgi:hypothetical protein